MLLMMIDKIKNENKQEVLKFYHLMKVMLRLLFVVFWCCKKHAFQINQKSNKIKIKWIKTSKSIELP